MNIAPTTYKPPFVATQTSISHLPVVQPDTLSQQASSSSCINYLFVPFIWLYDWITSLFCSTTVTDPIFKEEIDESIDIRGTKWLAVEHIFDYLIFTRALEFPELRFPNNPNCSNNKEGCSLTEALKEYIDNDLPHQRPFAFPLNEDSLHWRVLFIDPKTKTIEYFDSKANWKSRRHMDPFLQNIKTQLSNGFEIKYVLSESVQPDGHQCGPWILYFLLARLKSDKIDFKSVDIAAFRLEVQQVLLTYHQTYDEHALKLKKDCMEAYGMTEEEYYQWEHLISYSEYNTMVMKGALIEGVEPPQIKPSQE